MSSDVDYTVNVATTERLVELALNTQARQITTWDALDSKAWQAFGAGSVVLGLGIAGDLSGTGLRVAIAIYLLLAVGSLFCLKPRKHLSTPEISELWKDYYFRTRADLDHCVVTALATAGNANADSLKTKAWGLRLALICLAAETVTLAIAAAAR